MPISDREHASIVESARTNAATPRHFFVEFHTSGVGPEVAKTSKTDTVASCDSDATRTNQAAYRLASTPEAGADGRACARELAECVP